MIYNQVVEILRVLKSGNVPMYMYTLFMDLEICRAKKNNN